MNKKHLPGALVGSHGSYILGCVNASAPFYFPIWQTQETTLLTLSAGLTSSVWGWGRQQPDLNLGDS